MELDGQHRSSPLSTFLKPSGPLLSWSDVSVSGPEQDFSSSEPASVMPSWLHPAGTALLISGTTIQRVAIAGYNTSATRQVTPRLDRQLLVPPHTASSGGTPP
jgi:hypothetical protein